MERQMSWNEILEDAIIGKTLMALVDDGYRVEVSDQDGGGLFIYAAEDGGEKPEDGYKFWVRLVPGNGADVIVDYTTNLENTLKPANDFAAQFRQ
jgi:hypothetical protein